MSGWYLARGKQKLGPYPAAQIKKLADSGQLQTRDMVLPEGSGTWVAAGTIRGLFSPSRRFCTFERILWAVFLLGATAAAGWFYFKTESLQKDIDYLQVSAHLQGSAKESGRLLFILQNRLAEEIEKQKTADADNVAALSELRKQLAASQKQLQENQTTISNLKDQLSEVRKEKEPKPPTGLSTQTLPLLNSAILNFTLKNMGKQVSNGECAMLVMEAFKV